MSQPPLDLKPLQNALMRLKEGYARYQLDTSDSQIRDGLIQRYEFTYEISHKMLKRYLERTSANPQLFDDMQFADLIRSGNEQSLLQSDWSSWKIFREMRAKTSHTYDESVAQRVVTVIPDFIEEVSFFYAQLLLRHA